MQKIVLMEVFVFDNMSKLNCNSWFVLGIRLRYVDFTVYDLDAFPLQIHASSLLMSIGTIYNSF